ncbi:MAG: alpha/beta fold hydrolase [Candidatus Binatia bacterium]
MIHQGSLRAPPTLPHELETEHRITLADGRTLACLALGELGGAPVMYFHGYPGSRLEARLAAGAARRLGWRMFAPDRPGFGESTFRPGRTLGAWAADVAHLADRLGLERFAVVGVSGGGPYALACAARIPERLSRVALVCALGPTARKDLTDGMVTLNRVALAVGSRMPLLAGLAIDLAARLIRRHPEPSLAYMLASAPPADRMVLADPGYRELFAESMAEALRQGGRGAAWELSLLARPWDFRLEEVRAPVRIWQGLADNIVPPAIARHLAAVLPHSEPHYLPDEGHISLIVRHVDAVLADLRA